MNLSAYRILKLLDGYFMPGLASEFLSISMIHARQKFKRKKFD